MHGREKFESGSSRLLVGCYVASEEVHSKHRMLHPPTSAFTLHHADAVPKDTWIQ